MGLGAAGPGVEAGSEALHLQVLFARSFLQRAQSGCCFYRAMERNLLKYFPKGVVRGPGSQGAPGSTWLQWFCWGGCAWTPPGRAGRCRGEGGFAGAVPPATLMCRARLLNIFPCQGKGASWERGPCKDHGWKVVIWTQPLAWVREKLARINHIPQRSSHTWRRKFRRDSCKYIG